MALFDAALSWALLASERAPCHMDYYYRKALHAPWLVPLLACGARLYALGVTGLGREHVTLGLNVAIGQVEAALARYGQAGGDGGGRRPTILLHPATHAFMASEPHRQGKA